MAPQVTTSRAAGDTTAKARLRDARRDQFWCENVMKITLRKSPWQHYIFDIKKRVTSVRRIIERGIAFRHCRSALIPWLFCFVSSSPNLDTPNKGPSTVPKHRYYSVLVDPAWSKVSWGKGLPVSHGCLESLETLQGFCTSRHQHGTQLVEGRPLWLEMLRWLTRYSAFSKHAHFAQTIFHLRKQKQHFIAGPTHVKKETWLGRGSVWQFINMSWSSNNL